MSGILQHLMALGSLFDPLWEYVTLLLHGNGTNGAQNNTFIDSGSNAFTITRNGTPTQGSVSPFGPDWSNYFPGTASNNLSVANNTALQFGTGDFTVECWVYVNALAATSQGFICKWATNTGWELILSGTSSGTPNKFVFYIGSGAGGPANNIVTGTTSAVANTWYHLAFTRSSGTLNLFVNGVLETTATGNTSNFTETNIVRFGTETGTNLLLNGYISNARLLKGTALYTATFTPPSAPLTAITNTSLLTCQSNYFKDNSSNNFAITATGTPSVQRFSPFSMGSAYSTSVIGGSGYYNGSTDYLTIPSNAAFGYGTGSFTIEFWVNISTNSTITPAFFDQRNATVTQIVPLVGLNAGALIYYVNGAYRITGPTLPINIWCHIAVSREINVTKMFLNGVQAGSSYSDTNNYITSPIRIGASNDGSTIRYTTGYISNFRVVKGTALYTADFTPPTAPLTAITNTSLLLNYVNGGIYDNAMQNNLVTVGNAQISTTQSKFGGASMSFDGTLDYLTILSNPQLQFGTGNFTVECWSYLVARTNTTPCIFSNYNSYVAGALSLFAGHASGTITRYQVALNGSTFPVIQSTTNIAYNTWVHLAVVRNNGTITLYIDGVANGSVASSVSLNGVGTSWYIGTSGDAITTCCINGYIDDFRITKGVARYTAAFTPPTSQFLDY